MTTPTLWIGIQAANAAADATGDTAKLVMSRGGALPLHNPKGYVLRCIRSEGDIVGYGLVIARNVTSPYRLDSTELEPFRARVKDVLAEHGVIGPVDIVVQPVDEHYTVH